MHIYIQVSIRDFENALIKIIELLKNRFRAVSTFGVDKNASGSRPPKKVNY